MAESDGVHQELEADIIRSNYERLMYLTRVRNGKRLPTMALARELGQKVGSVQIMLAGSDLAYVNRQRYLHEMMYAPFISLVLSRPKVSKLYKEVLAKTSGIAYAVRETARYDHKMGISPLKRNPS